MIGVLVAAFATHTSPQEWTHKIHRVGSAIGTELGRDEALISDRTTHDDIRIFRRRYGSDDP